MEPTFSAVSRASTAVARAVRSSFSEQVVDVDDNQCILSVVLENAVVSGSGRPRMKSIVIVWNGIAGEEMGCKAPNGLCRFA